jgi:hypothetical protein
MGAEGHDVAREEEVWAVVVVLGRTPRTVGNDEDPRGVVSASVSAESGEHTFIMKSNVDDSPKNSVEVPVLSVGVFVVRGKSPLPPTGVSACPVSIEHSPTAVAVCAVSPAGVPTLNIPGCGINVGGVVWLGDAKCVPPISEAA